MIVWGRVFLVKERRSKSFEIVFLVCCGVIVVRS